MENTNPFGLIDPDMEEKEGEILDFSKSLRVKAATEEIETALDNLITVWEKHSDLATGDTMCREFLLEILQGRI